MLQSDVGAAGGTPESPHQADAAGGVATDGGSSGDADARRRRYGRRRGETIPVGETMVARLGPAGDEPFAAFDDIVDDGPARPTADAPLERLRFVALDCETTGQTPHRLVELGAVAFTLGGHVASFETLVHCTDRINPYARRIHGITTAALAGAPPADAVLDRFLRFASGAVLVEHSADAFDTRLLARTIGRPLDNDNVDTSRLAGKLWGLRDTIGLERLCTELGVTHRGPHTALGDAEATAACFLELLALGRRQFGWNTLADLLGDGQPPPRVPAVPDENRRRRVAGSRRTAVPVGEGAAMDPDTAMSGDVGRRRRRRGGRRRRPAGEAAAGASAQPAGGDADPGTTPDA